MPREGQTGTLPDGTRVVYRGGRIEPLNSTPYTKAFEQKRAQGDINKIERAIDGVQTADSLIATSGQARKLLDEGVPTGGFSETRLGLGKKIGNNVTSALTGGFIPNKPTTAKMERFQQLTNEAVLGDVGKLKGPLSDRDITFLKDTQAGLGTTPDGNRRALAAREWAATRLAAYESALQSWTQKLGAPSATNPRGQSFDAWFSSWANQNIPAPTGSTFTYKSKNAPATPVQQRQNPLMGPQQAKPQARQSKPASGGVLRYDAQGNPI